jgi:hypothetical protein
VNKWACRYSTLVYPFKLETRHSVFSGFGHGSDELRSGGTLILTDRECDKIDSHPTYLSFYTNFWPSNPWLKCTQLRRDAYTRPHIEVKHKILYYKAGNLRQYYRKRARRSCSASRTTSLINVIMQSKSSTDCVLQLAIINKRSSTFHSN